MKLIVSKPANKEAFITVYEPVSGYKAVLMVWDEECKMYVPWSTGFLAYGTKEEAIKDGVEWAVDEGIVFSTEGFTSVEIEMANEHCNKIIGQLAEMYGNLPEEEC
jgi:hypothetical protein